MKIIFLSRYQQIAERGAENFVKELSQRLAKFHQIEIFSGPKADSLSSILKENPDIVIPINGRIQSFKASLGRIIKGYKLLISGHSGIGRDDLWNIAIAKPDIFVALTESMDKWAKKFAWGSKVVKIPNGIDLDKFNPKGERVELHLERPIILSVGALEWYKGHKKAIAAVSHLKKGSLLIIGKGADEKLLQAMGNKELGNSRFKLMRYPYEQMPKVYRACDIFTLPSWDREAFGMVYLEAMATNLPVVAPDDVSRREIIGDAGIFVDTEDSLKYSYAIKQAIGTNWGNKPRDQASKFSWEHVAKLYNNVIGNILNK